MDSERDCLRWWREQRFGTSIQRVCLDLIAGQLSFIFQILCNLNWVSGFLGWVASLSRGGINKWFPRLSPSLHKKGDYVISWIKGNNKDMPFTAEKIGLSSSVVEADAKQIANMARQTFDNILCLLKWEGVGKVEIPIRL